MEKAVCLNCNGDGWTSEHSNHPHPDGDCCGECPIQVQCEQCSGSGYITFAELGQREYYRQLADKNKKDTNYENLPF